VRENSRAGIADWVRLAALHINVDPLTKKEGRPIQRP
jgi:hypothetical protein